MKHDPLTANGAEAVADYTPVTLAPRRNGWTAQRQRAFLCALAETGSVSVACKSAGITARSAYRLRVDPRGEVFAAAWDQALYVATNALTLLAFERASKGSYREYWKDGELVGETRQPSDSMLKFLLTRLAPARFNCGPEQGMLNVVHAQEKLPGLLDALTDCDVPADRLSAIDFETQPRQTAHDQPLAPRLEDESWDDEDDYDLDTDDDDFEIEDEDFDPDAE